MRSYLPWPLVAWSIVGAAFASGGVGIAQAEISPVALTDGVATTQEAELPGSAQFNASLVFFDHPTFDQINGLLQKNTDSRALKEQGLQTITNQIIPAHQAVAAAQQAYDAYTPRLREALGRVNQTAKRAYVAGVANTLIGDRLTALVQEHRLSDADKQHAEELWPAYCEAKLWELAANAQLGRQFLQRPTPVQLCEPYYAARRYFSDAALCGPSATAAGRDYFACIWREGVLKSALFAAVAATPCTAAPRGVTKGEAIRSWLGSAGGDGILRQILLPADRAGAADAAALQQTILDADLVSLSLARRHPELKGCRTAFSKPAPRRLVTTVWQEYKPSDLLAIGEAAESDTPALSLLPPEANDSAKQELYRDLVKGIRDFSQRAGAQHELPSYSDATMNAVVGAPLPLDPAVETALAADPGFSRLADFETPEVKALKAAQAAALVDLRSAQTQLAQVQQNYLTQVKQPIDANLLATAALTQVPGTAWYLNNYYMDIATAGGQLNVRVGFDLATKTLVGCTVIADGSACPVRASDVDDRAVPLKVVYTPANSLIRVEFGTEMAEAIGFPALPRTPGGIQFNEIPAANLRDRTIRLDVTLARTAAGLQTIGGVASVIDWLGIPYYIGTATGDDFIQKERAVMPAFDWGQRR